MTDTLQQTIHSAAAGSPILRPLAVFCANDLIVLLGAAFAVLAWLYRERVTREFAARVALSGVIALLCALFLGQLVPDPRPYLAEHYQPLAHAASDNGFPSDHTFSVALLAGWVGWLLPAGRRGWLGAFVMGAITVALGRLAIGAHHTLDVLGGALIAALSLWGAAQLRLPGTWRKPLLGKTYAKNV